MEKHRIYISNAFSLSMLDREECSGKEGRWAASYARRPTSESLESVKEFLAGAEGEYAGHYEIISLVGHADVAKLLGEQLGRQLAVNRVSVKLRGGKDVLIVGQYVGPRLPEGTTKLPEGAVIEWWTI